MNDINKLKQAINEIFEVRQGLTSPNVESTRKSAVRYLLGMYADLSDELDLSINDVISYLNQVRDHSLDITSAKFFSGNSIKFEDIISLSDHPLYRATEYELMTFKPGSLQIGPGEFFLYFYHNNSELGVDSVSGWDVRLKFKYTWIRVELKKLGSNFAYKKSDDLLLFDHYTNMSKEGKLDALMTVKPISDAKNPRIRSTFTAIDLKDRPWRDIWTFGNPHTDANTAALQLI